MTILVFGHSGQVATALRQLADVTAIGRDRADLSAPGQCAAVIDDCAPDMVINAAAYTAVDRAEDEEDLATRINATAPGVMARACAARDIPFVHISTDYVFDGSGNTARKPIDDVAPLNAYGRSKLSGERAIQAAGGRFAILRTSWVFSAHGSNFVKTMLRLGESRDTVSVVDDQIGGPTSARAIAAACLEIAAQLAADRGKSGIYHFSGAPDVSWYDFARAIFAGAISARAGRDINVLPISSAAYPTPAARPMNSRLDCTETARVFGIARPDWQVELEHVLAELEAAQ